MKNIEAISLRFKIHNVVVVVDVSAVITRTVVVVVVSVVITRTVVLVVVVDVVIRKGQHFESFMYMFDVNSGR